MKRTYWILLLITLVLICDQVLKIWVKTHMNYGDEIRILGQDWALIHFVENNGMAFGLSLGGAYGKLTLSLFRLFAVVFLAFFLHRLVKSGASLSLLLSFALILAGAIGNIIDSAFYGLIFSDSPFHGGIARLFPAEGGYAGLFHGKVVDMFYFPVWSGRYAEWIPWLGGRYFHFFKPVFNIADMAITLGVLNVLFFQRQFFQSSQPEAQSTSPEQPADQIPAAVTPTEGADSGLDVTAQD